jgi:uncharacterized membrane protein
MAIGPVQLLVIGFEHPDLHGQIMEEIDRLKASETIRLIDLLFIRKDADGNVERVHAGGLTGEDAAEFGATVGALIGLGAAGAEGAEEGAAIGAEATDSEVLPEGAWYVDDVLSPDTAAAVVLIEHRWAIGLRDRIQGAGGFHLADAWVHPLDLVAVGLVAAEDVDQSAV